MSRLLFLSTGIPHPSIGANVVAQYAYLRAFQDADYSILHVMLLKEGTYDPVDAERHKREFGSGTFRVLPVRVAGFLATGRSFLQTFVPVSLPEDIKKTILEFKPDVCFCMDIAAAGIRSRLPLKAKTLVWLGDLNFEVAWYKAWYAVKENFLSVFALPLAAWGSQKWKSFYRKTLRGVESVIVTLHSSVSVLQKLGIASKFLPYAWPVPPLPASVPPKPEVPTFVFFGHLSGLGSRSAFHFLIEKLYPRLGALWGKNGFAILICGIHALPEWAQKSLRQTSEMKMLGFVEDLASVLLSSYGVIVPIDVPIGNRTRIITAMGLGVPVIAHSNTARGNPRLIDGETCYLAKDADTFVERMRRAYLGGEEVTQIVRRAREMYDREYHPDKANMAMLHELDGIRQFP